MKLSKYVEILKNENFRLCSEKSGIKSFSLVCFEFAVSYLMENIKLSPTEELISPIVYWVSIPQR